MVLNCNDARPVQVLEVVQGLLAQLLQQQLRGPGIFRLFISDLPSLLDVVLNSATDVTDELGYSLLHLYLHF